MRFFMPIGHFLSAPCSTFAPKNQNYTIMFKKKDLHILRSPGSGKELKGILDKLGFCDYRIISSYLVFSCWPLISDFKNPTFRQIGREWAYDEERKFLNFRFVDYENIYIWQGLHTINTHMFICMMCALTKCKLHIVDLAPALELRNRLIRKELKRELMPIDMKICSYEAEVEDIQNTHCLDNIHEITQEEHEWYTNEWYRLLSSDTGLRTISENGVITNIPIDSVDEAILNAVNETEEFTNAMHMIMHKLEHNGVHRYNSTIFGKSFDWLRHDYDLFFYYERLKELMRQKKMQIQYDRRWRGRLFPDLEAATPEDFVNGIYIADHHLVEIKRI